MVTDINANVTQQVFYAPFGEVLSEYNAYWHQGKIPDYLFNAKELDEENGMYYYSARYYAPPVFTSRDPLFEKYPSISPYAYCANNPVKYIDPTGEEVILDGEAKKSAFKEFKAGAKQYGISLKMNKDGLVSGKYKGKGEISQDGQQILDAINSKDIKVHVTATNGVKTSSGHYMTAGGAFMGSDINADGTVTAKQEVNPTSLNLKSGVYDKPGQDMLHEVTEGYQGGLLAKKLGISISPASEANTNMVEPTAYSFYEYAHNAAIPSSGPISEITHLDFITGQPTKREYKATSGNRSAIIMSHPLP
jgi:RHS repeat-associated protein